MTAGPVRTVFLGSGDFAVPALDALADHPLVRLAAVVTAPPRPVGRRQEPQPTPVGRRATQLGQPTLTPVRLRDPAAQDEIAALAPDLLVLADYGQLVPARLLTLAPHGALNLHPSLLPRHRGAAPVPAAILAGDDHSGVTLMLMDEGLDSGPIVAQRWVALEASETAPQLEARLAVAAAELLAAQLGPWVDGAITPQPQPVAGVTMTRPLRREDGRLDPSLPAVVLERQVRAYQPWPGSFLETAHGRLVVWRARAGTPADGRTANPPESTRLTRSDDGNLVLPTADGQLELIEVQPAGGRRMTGAALLRGRPALVGSPVIGPSAAPSGG